MRNNCISHQIKTIIKKAIQTQGILHPYLIKEISIKIISKICSNDADECTRQCWCRFRDIHGRTRLSDEKEPTC